VTTAAITGHGARFLREAVAYDGVFLPIAGITSISGPGLGRNAIKVSNLGSAGGYHEYIGGIRDGGAVTIQANFLRSTYDVFRTDFVAGVLREYRIELPDSALSTLRFRAIAMSCKINEILPDGKISAEVVFKVSGRIVILETIPEPEDPEPDYAGTVYNMMGFETGWGEFFISYDDVSFPLGTATEGIGERVLLLDSSVGAQPYVSVQTVGDDGRPVGTTHYGSWLCFYFSCDQLPSDVAFVATGVIAGGNVYLKLTAGGLLGVYDADGAKVFESSSALVPGQWYKIAFYASRHDGFQTLFYVDDVLIGSEELWDSLNGVSGFHLGYSTLDQPAGVRFRYDHVIYGSERMTGTWGITNLVPVRDVTKDAWAIGASQSGAPYFTQGSTDDLWSAMDGAPIENPRPSIPTDKDVEVAAGFLRNATTGVQVVSVGVTPISGVWTGHEPDKIYAVKGISLYRCEVAGALSTGTPFLDCYDGLNPGAGATRSANDDGSDTITTGGYYGVNRQVLQLNPATGLAFTIADLDLIEVGLSRASTSNKMHLGRLAVAVLHSRLHHTAVEPLVW
jgi:hypothetical protein